MAERTLRGGVDSYVAQASPGQNRNGMSVALVQNGTSGNTNRMFSYLKAPAPVEAGVNIISAKLRYYVRSASHANVGLTARAVSSSWKAANIRWNNQPDVISSGIIAIGADATAHAGEFVEFDVTHHMQAVADGASWYGWRIVVADPGRYVTLSTAEAKLQNRRPELTVEYSNAPAAAVDLSPSGGYFISTGAPVLRYTYLDYGGNRELTFHQIQVENLASSVDYDTGKIAASEPEYDLDDGAFVALTGGQDARWRVKTWDGAGLAGPWSDWAYFERLNKGTLAIDNPAAAPDDFVQEVTPPIMWTHGGPWAQAAYQVIIQQMFLGKWSKIYDSRKRSGNDASLTLPKGVLTRANWSSVPGVPGWSVPTNYRVVVRTWDGQDRQHTPGDPVYYQATREFTIKEGTTAKVENLTASPMLPYPFTELTWNRDTAPDAFYMIRGGEVFDIVDPDDVFVSGTSYRYVDKIAVPNRQHEWAVAPVVNGKMSSVDELSIVRATIHSQNVWLTDPDRDEDSAVLIQSEDDADSIVQMTSEDQGEVYDIVGGGKRIVVTNSQPGYKGTVEGVLAPLPAGRLSHIDGGDWADRLLEHKAEPGKRLILTMSEMTLPIVIRNVTVAPTFWVNRRRVSFEFVEDRVPRWARP